MRKVFLNIESQAWPEQAQPLLDHAINKFKPLMTRVEADKIAAIVEASQDNLKKIQTPKAKQFEAIADTIEF
jgi:hypothetical protein